MKKYIYILAALLFLSAANISLAGPEPAIVPGPSLWTLDIGFSQPQQITVKLPWERKARRFWYIILTMTNDADLDVPFYPTCEMMTDTFKITQAYKDTRGIVFAKIKKRYKKTFPFLESLETASNRILQGQDNQRDMVIIWPDFDPKAKRVTLFLAGLSNETIVVPHPVATEEDGQPLKVYLRKTLQLDYTIGGDEKLRGKAALAYKDKRWIMR